jgi:hypothetical protein
MKPYHVNEKGLGQGSTSPDARWQYANGIVLVSNCRKKGGSYACLQLFRTGQCRNPIAKECLDAVCHIQHSISGRPMRLIDPACRICFPTKKPLRVPPGHLHESERAPVSWPDLSLSSSRSPFCSGEIESFGEGARARGRLPRRRRAIRM